MAVRVRNIEYISEDRQDDEGISLFAGVAFAGLLIFLFLYLALPVVRSAKNIEVNSRFPREVQVYMNEP